MPIQTISLFEFLEQVPELGPLPKPELNYLLSKCAVLQTKAQQRLFTQGDSPEYFYVVMEGRVAMGDCAASGRELITCIAARRDIFCCLPTLDLKPYPASAICITDAKVIKIPIRIFQEICQRHPVVYQRFVEKMCANLRHVEQRQTQSAEPVQTRIASLLVDHWEKNPHPVRLTRAEIAKLTGTTVETAIRTLSQMGKRGIIQSRRGLIKILDRDRLYELGGRTPPRC